jgi:hypothetical protein
MKIQDITLKQEPFVTKDFLSPNYLTSCGFCQKVVILAEDDILKTQTTLQGTYFCPFCFRHDFHTRPEDILIISYRGVIGYYYWTLYLAALPNTERTLTVARIKAMIDQHIKVGLRNPAFSYSDDTFQWFLDFNKIGKTKVPIRQVIQTTEEILACFHLKDYLGWTNEEEQINDEILGKIEKYRRTAKAKRKQFNCCIPLVSTPQKWQDTNIEDELQELAYFLPKQLKVI